MAAQPERCLHKIADTILSTADHCRSRARSRRFSLRQVSFLVGWYLPGSNETAGVIYNHRSPKGNRHMRRLLNQGKRRCGARTKGSIFEVVYRRMVPRLGHNQAIGVISHRQCRLIWLILQEGARYQERGSGLSKRSKQLRTWKMICELRNMGTKSNHHFLNRPKHPYSDF